MLVNEVRIVRLIELGRIGPSEYLVLKLRILEIVKELTKAVDQVTFGNDDKHRKTNIQRPLNDIELPGDFGGLSFNLVSRILDQAICGDHEKYPIDRTTRPVLLQQFQKFFPFARSTGFDLVKHQPTRSIKDNRMIGKPPIHV